MLCVLVMWYSVVKLPCVSGAALLPLAAFWVGCTMPSTRNVPPVTDTQHYFQHILCHVRLCDAVRIPWCVSKGSICFGVPGRERFDALWCVALHNNAVLKTGCLFVPDELVLLSHFVLVGGVAWFIGVYINFRLVSNVEWSSDLQWNPIASSLSTSFFNQHWNEI